MEHGEVAWDILTPGFIKNVSAQVHVIRASHRYCGGHGFKSHWSLKIFFWDFFGTA